MFFCQKNVELLICTKIIFIFAAINLISINTNYEKYPYEN